jgi:DNA-binding response OmpR family regulator
VAEILVLDDDPIQLQIRKAVLEVAEHDVHVATSAPAALAFLRARGPKSGLSAIITDHIMPGVSGAEFVRKLREMNRTVPVVVVSGMPDVEAEYAGLGVILRQKPFDPEELLALVRSLTAERAAAAC